jgi:hypothetical protein
MGFLAQTQYDAFGTITKIFQSAKRDILVVDNFLGCEILDMLAAVDTRPSVRILTHKPTTDFKVAVSKFLGQYGGALEVRRHGAQIHDRAIVTDDSNFYALGASIKDLGKNLSLMNRIETPAVIAKLRSDLATIWHSASAF